MPTTMEAMSPPERLSAADFPWPHSPVMLYWEPLDQRHFLELPLAHRGQIWRAESTDPRDTEWLGCLEWSLPHGVDGAPGNASGVDLAHYFSAQREDMGDRRGVLWFSVGRFSQALCERALTRKSQYDSGCFGSSQLTFVPPVRRGPLLSIQYPRRPSNG